MASLHGFSSLIIPFPSISIHSNHREVDTLDSTLPRDVCRCWLDSITATGFSISCVKILNDYQWYFYQWSEEVGLRKVIAFNTLGYEEDIYLLLISRLSKTLERRGFDDSLTEGDNRISYFDVCHDNMVVLQFALQFPLQFRCRHSMTSVHCMRWRVICPCVLQRRRHVSWSMRSKGKRRWIWECYQSHFV